MEGHFDVCNSTGIITSNNDGYDKYMHDFFRYPI